MSQESSLSIVVGFSDVGMVTGAALGAGPMNDLVERSGAGEQPLPNRRSTFTPSCR